jgi:hypothetical protein
MKQIRYRENWKYGFSIFCRNILFSHYNLNLRADCKKIERRWKDFVYRFKTVFASLQVIRVISVP